jgi:hypothetical protein
VTAPGETVWCASTQSVASGETQDCLAVSNGTSFAAATAAGVAALWLSYHQGSAGMEALRKANAVAWAFAEVLRGTVRQANGWNTSQYGAGIVDAARVLSAPLPSPPAVPFQAAELTRCEADLEALTTVFDAAPNARRRIVSFLRPAGADACIVAPVADEVAFSYAVDDRVREAVDRVSGPREPSARDLRRARDALRARDISSSLRAVLGSS